METADAIRTRRTAKVLADPDRPFPTCDAEVEAALAEILEVAGHAPYHKPADQAHRQGELPSPVPWRFHTLTSSACRQVIGWAEREGLTVGKMSNMLAAANACVLATWLPNPDDEAAGFQQYAPTFANMEHIAAASAAVQNLLLMATARGFRNYWSSGGMCRTEQAYEYFGIDAREVLLGAVFLFPQDVGDTPVKPGAHRDARGPVRTWSRTIGL